MSLQKVLETLYGRLNDGYLSVTYFPDNPADAPVTKYFPAEQLEPMRSYIKECGQRNNTYIGVNPRTRAFGPYQRGKREDVSAVVAAYQDYDVKGSAHKEKRLPETAEELYAFLDSLPVKPTFLVSTGNGVHAYWVFETPFRITDEDSRCQIESILKCWEQYVQEEAKRQHGWVFDSVSDLARMLRAVETRNFKTEERPVSKLVSMTENRCKPDDLAAYSAEAKTKSTPIPETDMFSLMGTGSAEELRKRCRFIDYCYTNAEDLPEPLWFSAISNVALTRDGHEAVHEMSRPYDNYTYEA